MAKASKGEPKLTDQATLHSLLSELLKVGTLFFFLAEDARKKHSLNILRLYSIKFIGQDLVDFVTRREFNHATIQQNPAKTSSVLIPLSAWCYDDCSTHFPRRSTRRRTRIPMCTPLPCVFLVALSVAGLGSCLFHPFCKQRRQFNQSFRLISFVDLHVSTPRQACRESGDPRLPRVRPRLAGLVAADQGGPPGPLCVRPDLARLLRRHARALRQVPQPAPQPRGPRPRLMRHEKGRGDEARGALLPSSPPPCSPPSTPPPARFLPHPPWRSPRKKATRSPRSGPRAGSRPRPRRASTLIACSSSSSPSPSRPSALRTSNDPAPATTLNATSRGTRCNADLLLF